MTGPTDPRINAIWRRAEELKATTLAFDASSAMPKSRVYTKDNKKGGSKPLAVVPDTDILYADLERYWKLPAESCAEGQIADQFEKDLQALGVDVTRDSAAERVVCDEAINGAGTTRAQTGNVIGILPGDPNLPSWHLSCHLDGTTPQIVPIPHTRDGDVVKSNGQSILRADDNAGIVIILKIIEFLQKNKIAHGDIYVSGMVAEEVGAYGAKEMTAKNLRGDIGLVFDGMSLSEGIITGGADIALMTLRVQGNTTHPAFADQGVNATTIIADILAKGWEIDSQSRYHGDPGTYVVTSIQSGSSEKDAKSGEERVEHRNAVPDVAIAKGQIRTIDVKHVIPQMQGEINEICTRQHAISCELDVDLLLPGFASGQAAEIVPLIEAGFVHAGLTSPKFDSSFGGSNVNFTWEKRGGNIVVMPIGAKDLHTSKETLDLTEMRDVIAATLGMFQEAAQYHQTGWNEYF